MKAQRVLYAFLGVLLALATYSALNRSNAISHNLTMHSVLSSLSNARLALSGFPACETRNAVDIPEAAILRKQPQGHGLFVGVLYWLAGDCMEALHIWHTIEVSSEQGSVVAKGAERALGLGYAELGDWRQALRYLSMTDSSKFAREVGNRAVRTSDMEQAANWYSISFEIEANYDSAQRLVNVLASQGRQQEIISTWQTLAARSPAGSLTYWLALAKTSEAQGDCAETASLFQKAIDLEPDFTPAVMSLAGVLRHCGDFDGAFRAYLRTAELSPGNDYVLAHIGITAFENNDFANAHKYLHESVAARPNAMALEYLSRLAFDEGRMEAAIGYMRDAVNISEQGGLYLRLGDLLAADGSPQDAERAYRRSLELQPDNNPASERLQTLVAP